MPNQIDQPSSDSYVIENAHIMVLTLIRKGKRPPTVML